MSCFETAKELFLHSAQGGTTAPGDVTNAVARHLDATHHHRGLNQKSEELSTGHEQHLSSVQRDQRDIRTPQITDKTYHDKSIGPLGPVFAPIEHRGRCPCINPMLNYEFFVESSPVVFL